MAKHIVEDSARISFTNIFKGDISTQSKVGWGALGLLFYTGRFDSLIAMQSGRPVSDKEIHAVCAQVLTDLLCIAAG